MKISNEQAVELKKAWFREKCRRSFHFFFKEFWEVCNKEPLVDAPHIKVLCDEAEKVVRRVVERKPKLYDLIINVPPGTSKSNIFSQSLEAWAWVLDPTLQFITASHSMSLALALSVKSKDIILSEKFSYYFPEVKLRFDLKGKQWFSNTSGGYRYSCTPLISPIGRHAHLIVVDDPINPTLACSDAMRSNVNEWFKSTLPTRVVDKDVSAMILVMQRLHEDDATGFLLSQSNETGTLVRHVCLPGELSDNVFPAEYKSIYKDGLLDPVRLNRAALNALKGRMGMYNYSGQIEQTPIPYSGGMFSFEKFRITETLPARIKRIVRSWDKAGTEGGGCNTAGVKIAELDNGCFIVLDVITGQWRADKREDIIKQTAQLDGKGVKIVIEQEGGSGGKESAEATVRNLRGFTVKVDHPVGDKAMRAEPFATQVNIGNVYLLKGDWNNDYIEELRSFPRGKYKDRVDASSMGFAFLVGTNHIDYKAMMRQSGDKKSVNGIILP